MEEINEDYILRSRSSEMLGCAKRLFHSEHGRTMRLRSISNYLPVGTA